MSTNELSEVKGGPHEQSSQRGEVEKLDLEKIVDRYNQVFEETVRQIITELKKDCETYAELEKKLLQFERDLYWRRETREKMEPLLLRLKSYVEKEKNDLPITNRP